MTRHSFDGNEWELIDPTDDPVCAIIEALDKIGADYISYAQVIASLKADAAGCGSRFGSRGATLILQSHAEQLQSGTHIGWQLIISPTAWGDAAYWSVGIVPRGRGALQTASVRHRDYVITMLRTAAGAR